MWNPEKKPGLLYISVRNVLTNKLKTLTSKKTT
jgi:hypothetical protein